MPGAHCSRCARYVDMTYVAEQRYWFCGSCGSTYPYNHVVAVPDAEPEATAPRPMVADDVVEIARRMREIEREEG